MAAARRHRTKRGRRAGREASGLSAVIAVSFLFAGSVFAGEATVAVAANAVDAVEALISEFERETGHQITVTAGSTGKLYAQILHGAPFDMFLAADRERPRLLVEQGLAVENSRRTWAIGRLVLWSPDPAVAINADTLRNGAFRRLAIANPDLAPYGAAARETLRALGLWEGLRPKIVVGENVGQAFAMVASGNAELGLLALSSVLGLRDGRTGARWEAPRHLYAPIRQDAVLLGRGGANPVARALYDYLISPRALEMIESFGFVVAREAGPLDGDRPR